MAPAALLLSCILFQPPHQEVVIHSHPYTVPQSALAAETNLVESGLVVRDYNGRPQSGFQASDFQLLDNGKPKEILSFTEIAATSSPSGKFAAPLAGRAVTLFFDDLHIDTGSLGRSATAAKKFVGSGLAPSDRISIATSSGAADLDFTNDAPAIQARLDEIRSNKHPIPPSKRCLPNRSARENREMQTRLALTAMSNSLHHISSMNGTRTVVLLSAGFPPAPQRDLDPVIHDALLGNVTIHTLDAEGLDAENEILTGSGYPNPRIDRSQLKHQSATWDPLEKLASATGGHFFHNTNDLAAAIEMAASPSTSYALSFNPGGRDGQFHNLKIALKNKSSYSLQFRPTYFSNGGDPPKPSALDAAVFSKENTHDLRADVACKPGTDYVSVVITLDINQVEFKDVNGRHAQQIVFLMALLDPQGAFVTGKEAVMDLALTDEKLASLKKEGLKAVATLNAPAGVYQVRTIVREAIKGNLAASTVPMDLRAN